jgi:hypothetical protein
MYINFKKLNLGIPFLKSDLDITNIIRPLTIFNSSMVLNPSLISLISLSGLKADSTVVIYYSGFIANTSSIHIDDEGITDQTNLNFVIDRGSAMTNWYNTIDGYSGHLSKNIFATVRRYDINKLTLIESINTTGAGLFQSGLPHNVSSIRSARWCFSVKLRTLENNVVKWEDAVRIFEKFIIN